MAEWLKAQSWKDCILQKGIEGSNPSLSEFFISSFWLFFVFSSASDTSYGRVNSVYLALIKTKNISKMLAKKFTNL